GHSPWRACGRAPVREDAPVRENAAGSVSGPAGASPASRPAAAGRRPPVLPAVPGVLTGRDILATAQSIAAVQEPGGAIRRPDGPPAGYALLTGCASTHQSLRCAAWLAEFMGEPQPDWELAASQLGHAVACHPEAFADKSRFSMDWYYPVLAGPVRGPAGRDRL